MSRHVHSVSALVLAVSVSACAAPSTTRREPIAPETVHTAQSRQQQLVITADLRQQQRVDDVGHSLLAAATSYCAGALAPRAGVRFANIHSFPDAYQGAARALGFSDTLIIVSVARGSAAARAGITVGDRVTGADGGAAPSGPNAASLLARAIAARRATAPSLALRHGDTTFLADGPAGTTAPERVHTSAGERQVSMPADTVCGYNLFASRKDDVNAWADGSNVTVTSAMLRFVTDNGELAALLAHEIAHNALGHIVAKQPSDVGSLVFSQEQEREADEAAMYMLARSGRSVAEIPGFWRRMAQYDRHNIRYVAAHATPRERLLRLEQAQRDMEQRIARGEVPRSAPSSGIVNDAVESLSTYELSTGDSVSYTFGPAVARNGMTLAEVRRRALQAYQDGNEALELRLYAQAEARFREAVLYDGSEARYHAALGSTLLKRGKRADAEAVLSAAVLLDVDNAEYRRLLIEARQRER